MLQQILKDQSKWTFETMKSSKDIGEMIREDALTSLNLIEIYRRVQFNKIPFQIMSLQGAHLEREFGADWIWGYTDQSKPLYAVQAKRLDIVKNQNLFSYTIDIAQLDTLIGYSSLMAQSYNRNVYPTYVFYNSIDGENKPAPEDFGCKCITADALKEYLISKGVYNQQSAIIRAADIEQMCMPWWRMAD